jgi:3-methylcrotonyl-CoA carboxylase alpha subunit
MVSPYYDAMLAKVIAWAPTREAAIDKLDHGLEEFDVRCVVINIPFRSALVTHPHVRANSIDTGFIERELKKLTAGSTDQATLSSALPLPPSSPTKGRRSR